MSFDIEASSSHGDFPLPKKTYKKLSGDMITYWSKIKRNKNMDINKQKQLLYKLI